MAQYNYGQAEIAEFGRQVNAGVITYEPGTANEIVRLLDSVIDELKGKISKIQTMTDATGLGGFPSFIELGNGFLWKRDELKKVYTLFVGGAQEMQGHYLKASGQLEAADQHHRASLKTIESARTLK